MTEYLQKLSTATLLALYKGMTPYYTGTSPSYNGPGRALLIEIGMDDTALALSILYQSAAVELVNSLL